MRNLITLNVSGLETNGTGTQQTNYNLVKRIHDEIIKPFLLECPNIEYVSELEDLPSGGTFSYKSHYKINNASDYYLCVYFTVTSSGGLSFYITGTRNLEDFSVVFKHGKQVNFSKNSTTNNNYLACNIYGIIDENHNLLAIGAALQAFADSVIHWTVADTDQYSGKNILVWVTDGNSVDSQFIIEESTDIGKMNRTDNTTKTNIPGKVIIRNKELLSSASAFIGATMKIKYLFSSELGTDISKSFMKIIVNDEELIQLCMNYWI